MREVISCDAIFAGNRTKFPKLHSMGNCAEKYAVRWYHITHQFIAGGRDESTSVHSREPKTIIIIIIFIYFRHIIHACTICPYDI